MRNRLVLTVAFTLLAAACSGSVSFSIGGQSPDNAATSLIEGEIATNAGLGVLVATCDDEGADEVGDEFNCTAETADGQTIEFLVVIDREDHIDVNSTNLLTANVLPAFESGAAASLGEQAGVTLPADSIDCGDEAIIFDGALEFVCAFYVPDSNDVYDITIELADLTSGDFDFAVADNPRS